MSNDMIMWLDAKLEEARYDVISLPKLDATMHTMHGHYEHLVTKFGDARRLSICDRCLAPWPCPTIQAVAEGWGWTG